MICATCNEATIILTTEAMEGITTRSRECSCGKIRTVELTLDRLEDLKSRAGTLYGLLRGFRDLAKGKHPESEKTAGSQEKP